VTFESATAMFKRSVHAIDCAAIVFGRMVLKKHWLQSWPCLSKSECVWPNAAEWGKQLRVVQRDTVLQPTGVGCLDKQGIGDSLFRCSSEHVKIMVQLCEKMIWAGRWETITKF